MTLLTNTSPTLLLILVKLGRETLSFWVKAFSEDTAKRLENFGFIQSRPGGIIYPLVKHAIVIFWMHVFLALLYNIICFSHKVVIAWSGIWILVWHYMLLTHTTSLACDLKILLALLEIYHRSVIVNSPVMYHDNLRLSSSTCILHQRSYL